MTDFQIGDHIAYVPYYNWKQHEDGIPLDEISDVRYGKIFQKRFNVIGGKVYPLYTVRFGKVSEEHDGVNFVKVEAKL